MYFTKTELVYSKLKEAICQGRLKPGTRLVVTKVAEEYKVSPMPVREALNRLGQDGFVIINPHAGAQVITVDLQELREIMAIRTEIESLAAKWATPLIDKEGMIYLESLFALMQASAENEDTTNYIQQHRKFHEFVYGHCGNPNLINIIQTLWNKTSITRTVFDRSPVQIIQSCQDHQEWLKAIKDNDSELVRIVVWHHLKKSFDALKLN